jgi:ANTAR domain/GAF domain
VATGEEWVRDKAAFTREDPQSSAGRGPLAAQFARLTTALLDASTVADVLEQVVRAACDVVPSADLVSITLRSSGGGFHTPVQTSPLAAALDQLQYELGEGPCVTAAALSGPAQVRSDDLERESAWPKFGPAAAARGVRAVLSVSLLPHARPPRYAGALNIYSRRSCAFGPAAHEAALLLATHASLALADTMAVNHAELMVTQLRTAVESRDVIGQAKGILMQRRGITAEDAFDLLRRASQKLNARLAEIARTLASHHTELDLPDLGKAGRRDALDQRF